MEQDDIIRGYRKYKNRPYVVEMEYFYNNNISLFENKGSFKFKRYYSKLKSAEDSLNKFISYDKKFDNWYSKIIYTIVDKKTNEVITTMVVE